MYSKMAFSNVKKSMKDFTIYFLTMAFGVCLFYMFNSLESQRVMLALGAYQTEMLGVLNSVMGGVSVFVSFILGFLIVYANSFLIKRRKKELGIYMLLGMEKGNISWILVQETMIMGVFALAAGLAVGILGSQGLAVLSAQLFAVKLEEFHFIFSGSACLKSILYFGLIFGVVILLNSVSISKYKLIDLLTAAKKGEKRRVKNLWFAVLLFIISVICLARAYFLIIENGLMMIDGMFWRSIFLGIAGTFLFFLSLSGFLLRVVKSAKGFYLRGLNMFVLKQINAKITTNFVSTSMICLMLFLAIGVLSTGFGMAASMTEALESMTPYSATVKIYAAADEAEMSGAERVQWFMELQEEWGIPHLEHIEGIAAYNVYDLNQVKGEELFQYVDENSEVPDVTKENLKNSRIPYLKLSEYNQALALQEKEALQLDAGEIAVSNDIRSMRKSLEELIDKNAVLQIEGTEYRIHSELQDSTLETTGFEMNWARLILPDDLVVDDALSGYVINIQFNDQIGDFQEEEWMYALEAASEEQGEALIINTKSMTYQQQDALATMFAYVAIYLGIVFLISCAAVLALQQLSESSDNIPRYQILHEIGVEEKEIHKALFMQIVIMFCVPLVLALAHSLVGISVVNHVISIFNINAPKGAAVSAIGIVVIYGGYMMVTYYASKGMLRLGKK